jgi:hypothetical protein
MTQHINIEAVICYLESDLEYYTVKYDNAICTQDIYYYMGIKKCLENALSTIKSQLP